MEREAVVSSNVDSIGFEPNDEGDAGVVEVEFRGGRVYHYLDVPKEVWDYRTDHESIGKWVARAIKPNYECVPGEYTAPENESDDFISDEGE